MSNCMHSLYMSGNLAPDDDAKTQSDEALLFLKIEIVLFRTAQTSESHVNKFNKAKISFKTMKRNISSYERKPPKEVKKCKNVS